MAGTFISYRREDAAGYAGRLRESLERRLGASRVFRDVDTLRPGQDFVQAIESRLNDCRVMLAVIGREWVGARDMTGSRRLDEPYDFVRLEIAAALARPNVLVVPVLVEGASMPVSAELPENIRPLARRHAVTVRDETWDADVDRLVGRDRVGDRRGGPVARRRTDLGGAAVGGGGPGRRDRGAAAVQREPAVGRRGWRPGAPPAEPGGGASTPAGGGDRAGTARRPRPPPRRSSVPAGPPISAAGGSPYTIDIPRIAEAAFGDAIYAVVSGNVVMRGDTPELRLRMRLMNSRPLRRRVLGRLVPARGRRRHAQPDERPQYDRCPATRCGTASSRSGSGRRRAPARCASSAGNRRRPRFRWICRRPAGLPVDEQAEIADSGAQAITAAVVRDAVPLLDTTDVGVTLLRASSRRFANVLRLALTIRMANRDATTRTAA